jgi:hypothetical protein
MFGDFMLDNDYLMLEMAQADRRAAEAWRFRHHKGLGSRILSAAWAWAKRVVCRLLHREKPRVAQTREQYSY